MSYSLERHLVTEEATSSPLLGGRGQHPPWPFQKALVWGCLAAENPAPGEAETCCEASAHSEGNGGKVYRAAVAFMSVLTWAGGI